VRQGPSQPPSARNGQPIYQESCAPCHGDSGGGDGPASSELPNGAAILADPAVGRQATPDEWFDVVKNGRMDLFMPPWRDRLSDEQIWDVVAYAFALSTSEGEITQGQAVWERECASCHGNRGAGDGPEAEASWQLANLGDPTLSASQSLQAWYDVTADGSGDMPGFQDKLSEDDIWAAVTYARTFSFKPLIAPAVPAGTGRLTGAIANGTPGGSPAAGLTVTLNTFDQFEPLQTKATQTGPDGSFEFANLPTGSNYVYLLTTDYQGTAFGSEVSGFAEGETELTLPVTVYEVSDEPGTIRADLAQWFLQPHQGGILVGELYRITHEGDRVYRGGDDVAPGKRAVLTFDLPPEATSLVLDGGELGDRFVRTQDGVVDTLPLAPGSRQILMRYLLPYSGTKAEFAHVVRYPIASFNALVADGPEVRTDLEDRGQQTANETPWNSFGADNVPAGETISLRLSGLERANPAEAGVPAAPAVSSMVLSYQPGVLVGVIALSVVIAGVILLAYVLRKPPAEPEAQALPDVTLPRSDEDLAATRHSLLESIAELDDAFAADHIDFARYDSLRTAQKRSLLLITRQLADRAAAASTTTEQGVA
jgi:mono/diheme cytochrome c family protein